MNTQQGQAGLTLLELCITVTISVVVVSAVTASLSTLVARNESFSTINQLYHAFQTARSEAIKRGQTVTLCPLNSNQSCSNSWDSTISIFPDPDNSRSRSENEPVLRQVTIDTSGSIRVAPRNRRYFQFNGLGGTRGSMGNITYCPKDPSNKKLIRQLILNLAGRLRFAADTDGDGVPEKGDGSPITCE